MTAFTKMTQLATAEVVNLLKQNIRVIDAARKMVEYLPGWSDQEIATRAGVPSGPVQALRLRHFGKLAEKSPKLEPPAKADRLERLEAGISELLKEVGEIRAELRFLREAAGPSNVTLFEHAARVGK